MYSINFTKVNTKFCLSLHYYTANSSDFFRFIKKMFILTMIFFSSLSEMNSLIFLSMSNQECKVRPQFIGVSSDDPIFYSFSIKINKCSCNCIILMIHIQEFGLFMMLKI